MFLKTAVRFGILTGLFVAMILLASVGLLQQKSSQIQLLHKELAGNELLQYLQQVRRNLGEYRLSHLDAKAGSQDDTLDQLSLATSELKSRLDRSPEIQSLSASAGPIFTSLDKLLRTRDKKVQDDRQELKQMSQNIQQLGDSIGDASNLVLDSHIESYYVMTYLLSVGPREQEHLVEIAETLPNPAEHQRALYSIDQLRGLIRDHQRSLSNLLVQTKNAKLRAYLERSAARYQDLQDFSIEAEAALKRGAQDLEPLTSQSQEVLKNAYRAWNDGSIRLGELLTERQIQAKREYSRQAWLLFSTTLILVFACVLMCIRLQGGIRDAQRALADFNNIFTTSGTLPAFAACQTDELDRISAQIGAIQETAQQAIANLETERDAALERSRLSDLEASQTSNALERAPVPLFAVNPNLDVIYLNAQAETLFDQAAGDLVGRSMTQIHPDIPWAELIGKSAELNHVPWEAISGSVDLRSSVLPDGNTMFVLHPKPGSGGIQPAVSTDSLPDASATPLVLEILHSIGQAQGKPVFTVLVSLDNALSIRRSLGDDAYAHGLQSIADDLRAACEDIFYCCVHSPGEIFVAGLCSKTTQSQLESAKRKIRSPLMYRRQPMYLDISLGYSLTGATEEARMHLIQEQSKRFGGLDSAQAA